MGGKGIAMSGTMVIAMRCWTESKVGPWDWEGNGNDFTGTIGVAPAYRPTLNAKLVLQSTDRWH